MTLNHRILLRSRPVGMPSLSNFDAAEDPIPQPGKNEILVQNLWLSLDPYMRFLMDSGEAYSPPVQVGDVMQGRTVGRVLESRDAHFQPGDYVLGEGKWQQYCLMTAEGTRKLEKNTVPLSAALGVLGWPGQTAWVGMKDFAELKAGETVVVSSAAGAVGSVAGQIAKLKGCQVVGIAGGPDKARYVVEKLGFDACVDHRAPNFAEALAVACPNGVDVNFENVGGQVLKTVWPLLNDFARVLICGLIAEYNGQPASAPELTSFLLKRIRMQAFFIRDHLSRTQEFLNEVTPWVREGKVRYRDDIVEGLDNAPRALIGLFHGQSLGKLIVHIAD